MPQTRTRDGRYAHRPSRTEAVADYVANEFGKPVRSEEDDGRGDEETTTGEPEADRANGEAVFAENCAHCHN